MGQDEASAGGGNRIQLRLVLTIRESPDRKSVEVWGSDYPTTVTREVLEAVKSYAEELMGFHKMFGDDNSGDDEGS